ncbi:MAG TPA: adenylate/guanylate cyclase domain-containing protein [Nitrososphaeraceae archaeon]|nr:adenylate/guanylate cyclase domain-containing protein [Nitrososphaeraceae archaeon]
MDPEHNYSTKPKKRNKLVDNQIKREGINPLEDKLSLQQQTVLNLYNSGITIDIIALQLDITKQEVINIIRKVQSDDKRKEESVKQVSDSSSIGMFYLDSVIDSERFIKDAQKRIWKSLKLEPKFNIPLEETQEILEKFCESKIILVILHADLVGSTKLSMTLPTEKLATIVQAFTQEMSLLISAYGGHVFKYVGDAILAFFFLNDNNLYLPSSNAVNCGRTMIRVMQDGINPILNDNDYPEMGVRIGIDAGENVVVRYGWSTNSYTLTEDKSANKTYSHNGKNAKTHINNQEEVSSKTTIDNGGRIKTNRIVRKPHLDILGYTASIAAKMTGFATPNRIIIGQSVYKSLDSVNKSKFKRMNISKDDWDYINPSTGKVYDIYASRS